MTILDKILSVKKEEVELLHKYFSRSSFSDSEYFHKNKIAFTSSLKLDNRVGLIAEIKKASPSKGILKEEFNHKAIAKNYMTEKVDAISVLTDDKFFKGNISFLKDVADIKAVPLLRKDFFIDEYQILEAKANGADAILLIAEALSKYQISELTSVAHEINLDVLLEIHLEEQLEKIDFNKNKIIGINNRDLSTFNVDLKTTLKLANQIPKDCLLVSESGINTKADVDYLKNYVDAFLVGEYFMKSKNISETIKEFLEWCKK